MSIFLDQAAAAPARRFVYVKRPALPQAKGTVRRQDVIVRIWEGHAPGLPVRVANVV
jgi:hypothetical protein